MSDEVSDEEKLRRFAEWVERGDATVEIYRDTPLGSKIGVKTSADMDEAYALSRRELMSSRAASDFEDVIIAVDEGDLDAVNDVDDEVWEEFVVIADEALEDVGEVELREAHDG